MDDSLWQFWIDVGGTFTDCVARDPGGNIHRHKLLSSGVTKGTVAAGSTRYKIIDPARERDPANFWADFEFRLLDGAGNITATAQVDYFFSQTGELFLYGGGLLLDPQPGQAYELVCPIKAKLEAPVIGIRYILGIPLIFWLPPMHVRLGTTRGTNALLTRRGARVAMLATSGFADAWTIGNQDRPRLFELSIQKRKPLAEATVEIEERIAADGSILTPLDEAAAEQTLRELQSQGIESLAICLLNAYANPAHEERLEQLAAEVGFREISRSTAIAPLIKLVTRGDTTTLDAYLNPVLREYVERLQQQLRPNAAANVPSESNSNLCLLTSAGGLVNASEFRGIESILSGPAGGVVGYARAAQAAGFERAIGFDMGGTSTDVSRFDGDFQLEYETQKAGVRLAAPMLAIETVAAGGGSICGFDGVKLVVGPDSAGADPGPACYGRGGPLTVTDANLLLGRILPDRFPFALDRAAALARAKALIETIYDATEHRYTPETLAAAYLQIAVTNMAAAIRTISVAQGTDVREFVLVAFGGAAPQTACAVAEELGMTRILIHPDASLLSALGAGLADVRRHAAQGVYRRLDETPSDEIAAMFQTLAAAARGDARREGVAENRIVARRFMELRYAGQDSSLMIPCGDDSSDDAITNVARRQPTQAFAAEHERLYGFTLADRPLELVALRVEAIGRSNEALPKAERLPAREAIAAGATPFVSQGACRDVPLYVRNRLAGGDRIEGPALLVEQTTTTVIEPNWQAEALSDGQLLLTRKVGQAFQPDAQRITHARQAGKPDLQDDPAMLEVFNNHLAAIATQMGHTLRNTAVSVNVKQRLDYSCALFTAAGELVVNAPHVPVHLGAMGATVRGVLREFAEINSGDVFITNDPYRGGSHLPDVTVITPVHDGAGRLSFFTASRAHHAELGGIAPGSMPPHSRNLAEEGVLIRAFKLFDADRPQWESLRALLSSGRYPSRQVEHNLADVAAQVAANRQGMRDLLALIERYTWPVVEKYMQGIRAAAERKMRMALSGMADGEYRFADCLDDGSPIAVCITIAGDAARIDFTGAGPVMAGNLNANRAIVTAAVMYCLRLLIDEDIPLNEGVLAPVEIIVPECLLNPPAHEDPAQCAAVVGGNVETSQRVVDVLLAAFGLAAASQGTMNNLLFGDATFGYYETICGGEGGSARGPGADAVHTHMTNTRLTDPEILEQRYPVRLRRFQIRQGSGGAGKFPGGNGVVRELEFLQPLDVSLLTQRRGDYPPFGLQGGEPGSIGRNTFVKKDGENQPLAGLAQIKAEPGDRLMIETPGGGGFDPPP